MDLSTIVFKLNHKSIPPLKFILPITNDDLTTIKDFYLLFELDIRAKQSFVQTIKSMSEFSFRIEQNTPFVVNGEQLLQLLELDHDLYTKIENVWNQKQELVIPICRLILSNDMSVHNLHTFNLNYKFNNKTSVNNLLFITGSQKYTKKENYSLESYFWKYQFVEMIPQHKEKFEFSAVDTPAIIIMKKPDYLSACLGKGLYLSKSTASHLRHNTYLDSDNQFCFLAQSDAKFLKFKFENDKNVNNERISFIVCYKQRSVFSTI